MDKDFASVKRIVIGKKTMHISEMLVDGYDQCAFRWAIKKTKGTNN